MTYADFPIRFIFKKDIHQWSSRKYGFSIGKLYYTPPESGEIYYLRTLLNIVKGPTCYEDIKIVDGVHYCSFKDACYAMGLLDDEKEYIDGIVEVSSWTSAEYLRCLFVILLFSDTLSKPKFIWEKTWELLFDDIIHRQRRLLGHDCKFLFNIP